MNSSCSGSTNTFIRRLPADKPFTHHEPTLRVALMQAIKARGQTAIYNAVDAGLDYVSKGGFERQVLIVLSDGGDNASAVTRAQVLANAQASNAVIYTIALVDPMDSEADPGFLKPVVRNDRRRGVPSEERRGDRATFFSASRATSATCTRSDTFRPKRAKRLNAPARAASPRRGRSAACRPGRNSPSGRGGRISPGGEDMPTMIADPARVDTAWLNRALIAFGARVPDLLQRRHGPHLAVSARRRRREVEQMVTIERPQPPAAAKMPRMSAKPLATG